MHANDLFSPDHRPTHRRHRDRRRRDMADALAHPRRRRNPAQHRRPPLPRRQRPVAGHGRRRPRLDRAACGPPTGPGSATAPRSAAARRPPKSSCGSPPPPRPTTTTPTTTGRAASPRLLARAYAVFAAEQVDGADEIIARRAEQLAERDTPERIAAAEAYFAAVGATVIEGGNRACYQPATDTIHLPSLAQFDHAAHYYGTRAHETVHWTGHPDRLARDLTGRFGSDSLRRRGTRRRARRRHVVRPSRTVRRHPSRPRRLPRRLAPRPAQRRPRPGHRRQPEPKPPSTTSTPRRPHHRSRRRDAPRRGGRSVNRPPYRRSDSRRRRPRPTTAAPPATASHRPRPARSRRRHCLGPWAARCAVAALRAGAVQPIP